MTKRLYIVEGQDEENFLRQMIGKSFIQPGKIKIKNLMQNFVKASDSIMDNKYDVIVCVFDTDVTERTNLEYFLKNIKMLRGLGKVFLVAQKYNFEDELKRVLSVPDLLAYYHQSGYDNLKRALTTEKYTSLSKEEYIKYCCDDMFFLQILKNAFGNCIPIIQFKKGKEL